MRAWLFQAHRHKSRLGEKAPWSVGWLDHEGRRRSEKLGAQSTADKYRKKMEAELALGLCGTAKPRTRWADFQQRFEDLIKATRAAGTLKEYRRSLEAYKRLMQPVYVDSITTADIDQFISRTRLDRQEGVDEDDEATKLLSPASIDRDLRALKVVLQKAHQWGMLASAASICPCPRTWTPRPNPLRRPHALHTAGFIRKAESIQR